MSERNREGGKWHLPEPAPRRHHSANLAETPLIGEPERKAGGRLLLIAGALTVATVVAIFLIQWSGVFG